MALIDTRPRQISFPGPDRHLLLVVFPFPFLLFALLGGFWDSTFESYYLLTDVSIYSELAQWSVTLRRSI